MAVRNVNAVANVLNVVTTLVTNGLVQEVAEREATAIDVERISSVRKLYANEHDFREDMLQMVNAVNRLFFDGTKYRITLQNRGRGRNGGWWIVAIHQGITKQPQYTDYDDDDQQANSQQEVTQKQVAKQEVTQVQESQVQVQQKQKKQEANNAVSAVSIVKRPDKDRSALVFIEKDKRELLKYYCQEHGMWLMWNRRYGAWNVQKTGIAGLVDALKASGMKVRVDEHVQAWIAEDRQRQQKSKKSQEESSNTITIKLIEV